MNLIRNSIKDFPPLMKLLTVAFVALGSFSVFLLLGLITGKVFFGVGIDQYAEAMKQTDEYTGYLKYMQAIYSLGIFLVPALLLGVLFYGNSTDRLGLYTRRLPYVSTTGLAIVLVVASMPFINITAEFNSNLQLPDSLSGIERWMRDMENQAMGLTKQLLGGTAYATLIANLVVVALIPALGEEFLFRGVVQRVFYEMTRSPHAAVWLAAALFSFLHFQFFGFLPRLILGVMFGYLLVWSRTIWVPVIAHFVNNGLAVVFYFLYNKGMVGGSLEQVGTSNYTPAYLAGSILMLVIVMLAIYHNEKSLRAMH